MDELYKKVKPYLVYFWALLGGGIMPFAFAPYHIGILGILSPAILLGCLAKRTPAKAFLLGWIYGIGMFGLGTNWIYVSIHDYGYTSATLASIITALFVLLVALYPAIMSALFNRLFPQGNGLRALLAFPIFWVTFEMLRGWLFTGFPWLFVGYTQIGNHLRSFAPIGGVFLVSYVAVLCSSLLYLIFDFYYSNKENTKMRTRLLLGLLAIWAAAFSLHQLKWSYADEPKLEVALVQGNIAQLMRWDPQFVNNIIKTYETLTATTLATNLIIWPEGAIPLPLPLSYNLFEKMNHLALSHHFALISGVPTQLADQEHYHNALFGVGLAKGIYYKTHLVPFGEYVPFEKWLRGMIAFFNLPMSSFIPGPPQQGHLLVKGLPQAPARTFRLAPAICYEIAYPLFVQKMSQNADFILTVSNDTWFGASIGPHQHLQIAQFRALETNRYVIRATNTGLTAIIQPDGELQTVAPQFKASVLHGSVMPRVGQTPWVRFGIWPLAGLFVFLLGLAFYLKSKQKP